MLLQVHITATIISSLDFLTSIISGVVIFTVLGQLKLEGGYEDISDVVQSSTGLAFIAYPNALSRLAVPQLWSVMFFFMLFLLGLDSEFALLETVLTAFYDGLPKTRKYKPALVFLMCVACFLLSLPCVSSSGAYVFQIMDDYGGGMSVMWIAILETIFIMWIYGVKNFSADVDFMLKLKTSIILKILWVMVPILLTVILGLSLSQFSPPSNSDTDGKLYFPDWIHGVGIFLILVVVAQIPFWALVTTIYYLVSPSKRISDVARPTAEWGPGDRHARKEYLTLKSRLTRPIHGYENHMMYPGYPYLYPAAGYHHSYHM